MPIQKSANHWCKLRLAFAYVERSQFLPNKVNLQRAFLGWDRPILHAAVDWFQSTYAFTASDWDLSTCTIVLPGRRAGRRLSELLRQRAAEHNVRLKPPNITTSGELPERLYNPTEKLASELEQTLAWCSVLRGNDPSQLTPLIANPPPPFPVGPWLELGGAIRRLYQELAAEDYCFADIASHLKDSPNEASRWTLLEQLSNQYTRALAYAGRSDPYSERRKAISENRCESCGEVVLIASVDLSRSLRSVLRAIAENATVLIGAPDNEASYFDSFGCVIAEKWLHKTLEISDTQLVPATDVEDQSVASSLQLSRWSDRFTADQITIGITDESMIAHISEQLAMSEIETYAELGRPLIRTAPGRMVSLIMSYVLTRSFDSFSSLVRHADVCATIDVQKGVDSDWLVALDNIRSEHYPSRTDQPLPVDAAGREIVQQTIAIIDDWLQPLFSEELSLADWCDAMRTIITSVYQTRVGDLNSQWHDSTQQALALIEKIIDRLGDVSDQLELNLPPATISEMLVAQLSDVRVLDKRTESQVPLVGWLDLALDDSQAMCVVGLNEPFVPESVVADPFLPGKIRHQLNIADNDQRFARDAYALSAILHCRPEVALIVGRTGADGSPTPPSRLLAACKASVAAKRTRMLLDEFEERPSIRSIWSTDTAKSELPVPLPVDYTVPKALSVTAFGDYLRCPYRFYLRHIAKLRPLDDSAREMAANQFGNLVHDSLETFGLEGPKHSTDASEVEECLLDTARDLAVRRFGEKPSAPVRLQITSALNRLKIVAKRHVERAQQGWLLWAAEKKVDVDDGAFLNVDGSPFGLKGRIDRIDYHEDSDSWAVIDYKTHRHHPMKKHYKKSTGQWLDLQLPLYRYMLRSIGVEVEDEYLSLGYFNIGEKESDIKFNPAGFMSEHYSSADETAANVVRGVREGRFDPNPDAATSFDDYGVICQTGVIEKLFAASDDDQLEEVEA